MGAKIRQLREQRGMTQKQLADALGLSQVAICLWETGENVPTIQNLYRLADILGCEPGELLAK